MTTEGQRLLRDVVVTATDASSIELECQIRCWSCPPEREYRIEAALPDRPAIEAKAGDCFEALRLIRSQLETDGILLCCAGARTDVWASGMQRDMGMGLHAYILTLPRRRERPEQIDIFDAAPRELVGTVRAQERFNRDWLASPRLP